MDSLLHFVDFGWSSYRKNRVATVREKFLENEGFFPVREKAGNFVDGREI